GKEEFVRFKELFEKYSEEAGKEQYLVPYFISGHPGCEVKDMVELSDYLDENGWRPQQVQDFTPTPMTLATDMYYSGYHPNTGKPVHVPRGGGRHGALRAVPARPGRGDLLRARREALVGRVPSARPDRGGGPGDRGDHRVAGEAAGPAPLRVEVESTTA